MANPLAKVKLAVPLEVRVAPDEAGFIEWRTDRLLGPPPKRVWKTGRSARGCLSRFVRLATASDEAIAEFAASWGVMGFCASHRLPGVHGQCPPAHYAQPYDASGVLPDYLWWRDASEDWRRVAGQMAAILRLALAIDYGKPGDKTAWDLAWFGRGPTKGDPHDRLASMITLLVGSSGMAPRMSWDGGRFVFGLDLGGAAVPSRREGTIGFTWPRNSLYSVLIAQLAAAVASGHLVPCTRCGQAFDWEDAGTYSRSPRSDRGAYCGDECRSDARLLQKSEYMRRRRKGDSDGKAK